MSTKTTFKRIALVTVAALGFGTMAAISPASATAVDITHAVISQGSSTNDNDAANPFATGSAITMDLTLTTDAAMVSGDTFTVTYYAYNPAGETLTGLSIMETSSAVSQLYSGVADETGTTTVSGTSIKFVDSHTTIAGNVIGSITIPAAAVTTGGIYKLKSITVDNLTGTHAELNQDIHVSGMQVTQGTVLSTNSGAAVTGGNARAKFFFPKRTVDATEYRITTSGVGTILSEQGSGANNTPSYVSGTTYAGGVNLVTSGTAATAAAAIELNLTSAEAGVQTLTFWTQNPTTGQLTATFTGTVTWGAAPAYAASTAFIGATGAAVTADIAVASRTSTGAYSATAKARIDVKQYTDVAKTIQTAGTAKAVLVSVSGAGAVDTAEAGTTRGAQALVAGSATASNDSTFYLFADGRTGKATVTVSVNGVEVKSWTWAFTGVTASLKEDADNSPTKIYIGVGEVGIVSVLGYDSNNVLADSTPDVYATSDTSTVATVSSFSASGAVTVTGVAAGKTTINLCVGACTSATIKVAIPVEITKTSAKTAGVTLSFDKTSYEPGEKMTLTVKAVDTNDRPVADGSRELFAAALTSNVSFGGASVALPTASVDLEGGEATYVLYAPSSAGTVTVSGKEGAAVGLTERAAWAAANTAAYTAPPVTVSVAVVNSGLDAAAAAAEEATAAANDATDAALSAAEAAEAATAMAQEAVDAVAELSASVTKLISALRAQITTLTNLVVKIQKKVKA
jgi:hypothetical protein